MKTLYLQCQMGAAGDMLTAALLELLEDKTSFLAQMNALGLPGVTVTAENAVSCGITGTHVSVTVDGAEEDEAHHHHHHHHHSDLHDIRHLIGELPLPEAVKRDALAVYDLLAQAESHVHGCEMEHIHFHEVGTLDAVADIVGVCLLMHMLSPDQVLCSPVHVGSGQVRCAHGILPVPAPATAWLLRGIPAYGGSIDGELCTPTGAALLRYFVTEFGNMPVMTAEKVGYGMGKKEFGAANCVRAFWGETPEEADSVLELRCNVDDMTGEALGFAAEELMAAGALDVFTTPVGMKKNRPGVLLTCLCRKEQRQEMVQLLLRCTTTLGVRETTCRRHVLQRKEYTVDTACGPVRVKESAGYGVRRRKMAYDDRARLMRQHGLTWEETEHLME